MLEASEQIARVRTLLLDAGVYEELADQFEEAAVNIPQVSPVSPTRFLLLVPYLDDKDGESGLVRTLRVLWNAIDAQKKWGQDVPDFVTKPMLRLADGHIWKPGVRWVLYNFASYRVEKIRHVWMKVKIARALATVGSSLLTAINGFYSWKEAKRTRALATVEPLLLAATNDFYAYYCAIGKIPYPYMSGVLLERFRMVTENNRVIKRYPLPVLVPFLWIDDGKWWWNLTETGSAEGAFGSPTVTDIGV